MKKYLNKASFVMGLATVIAPLVLAASVSAQDTSTPEATVEVPAESHQLDWFIGTWSVASKVNMGGDQWMEETLSSTVKPILGGYALMETFTGMLGGAPIDAISIRTYNSTLGKWEQRWLDNTSPGFAEYTGQYADGQFIGYSNRSFQPTTEGGRGVNSGVREVFFNIEADHFSWRLESTQDSGQTWTPIWYLEYTRTADGQ